MPTTTYMNLTLPTVSSTAGPEWASDLNTAFDAVDAHDHTTGKGTPVVTAGININADFEMNSYNLTEIRSIRCDSQSAALALGSDINEYYVKSGLPYFNNSAGTALQLVASTPTWTIGDLFYAASSTTVSRVSAGAAGTVLTSTGAGAAPAFSSLVTNSYEINNASLSTAVGASALTVTLNTSSGATPSTSSPVLIGFRSSTIGSGIYNVRSVTSALTLTVVSGATLGTVDAVASYLYVYALDNSGTVELAISSSFFDEGALVTTTTMGTGSDLASGIYSTTGRSNVPVRLLGRFLQTQTTAGTWGSVPTAIAPTPFNTIYPVAIYESNAGQSISDATTTIVNFEDKLIDTMNSVTTGASWKFTAPIAGKYYVKAGIRTANVAWDAAEGAEAQVYKNGSAYKGLGFIQAAAAVTVQLFAGGSTVIDLAATDYVDVRFRHNRGAATTLDTDPIWVWVAIGLDR